MERGTEVIRREISSHTWMRVLLTAVVTCCGLVHGGVGKAQVVSQAHITRTENLARHYESTGQLELAEEFYKQVLTYRANEPLSDSVVAIVDRVAWVCVQQNRMGDAEKWYTVALNICRDLHGPLDGSVGREYSNLSLVYRKLGQLTEAEDVLKKCLEIRRKENMLVDSALNDLAAVYVEKEDFVQAEACFKEAIGLLKKKVSDPKSDRWEKKKLKESVEGLCAVYRSTGHEDKAKAIESEFSPLFE